MIDCYIGKSFKKDVTELLYKIQQSAVAEEANCCMESN